MTKPTITPCGLFSSRETLAEAVEYSSKLIDSLPVEVRAYAHTALWVSLNTALAEIEKKDITKLTRSGNVPKSVGKIASIPAPQAAQLVRDLIIPTIAFTKDLDNCEPITIFLLLVTRLFDMDEEDILSDLAGLMAENFQRRTE